ncbi:hypothetical protein RND81_02G153000 [Saponaria officinalis]|uniref:Cytochrome P450 n=1 Tax=Saponaria officinalis TaxID=3572 RepID=A0AAW1MW37_SAPOF
MDSFWVLVMAEVGSIIAFLLIALLSSYSKSNLFPKLPPGPKNLPIISTVLWLRKSTTELEAALRTLRPKFGPIITIRMASRPFIFICSRSLAHEALVQNGAIFADRPKALPTTKILTSNQHNITSVDSPPFPSQDFSHARRWVLHTLISHLGAESASDVPVKVTNHFHFAMFSLLVYIDIEALQHRYLTSLSRFQVLNIWPSVTYLLLHTQDVLIPHIRARNDIAAKNLSCYVDTLMTVELSENIGNTKRKLSEQEMVMACSEFFNVGTDTTATALQWIMANLVKNPQIQTTLFEGIKELIGEQAKEVGEDDLPKLPYLKAIVLEGLRRHPPAHFVLPHAVIQETELGGYTVPKNAVVNFTIAVIGRDLDVWDDQMKFKPERFLTEEVDITVSREIKMMPFGAGRRMWDNIAYILINISII